MSEDARQPDEITEAPDIQTDEAPEIQLDEAQVAAFIAQLHTEQNLVAGIAAGLAGALVSAIAWAAITASTGYQIGYVAIAVGFVVGFAIRIAGKGMDPIFGYIGAGLALLGCAVGNLLSVSYFVADELDLSFADFLLNLNVPLVVEMMKASFSPMDLLFYGLAIYAGYKFSFRQITQDELNELAAASA